MRTEQQKMLAGELYDPMDSGLVAARTRARDLCLALNAMREAQQQERRSILHELFGTGGDSVWMQPPFFCDYGSNISLGERVFSTSTASCWTFAQYTSAATRSLVPPYRFIRPCIPLRRDCAADRSSASRWKLGRMSGSEEAQSSCLAFGLEHER